MTSRSFPFFASIVCLCGVVILCGLGAWQIKRLSWKNDLQAELSAAFAKPVSDLGELNFSALHRGDIHRGFITGTPDMSKAIILHGRVYDGRAMLSLVVPFQTKDKVIPVEIGCGASIDLNNFIRIKPYEPLSITGVARVPSWSMFTPQNIPDKGDWWRLDAQQLSRYWGYPSVEPVFFTQEDIHFVGAGLTACPIEKSLRNDHLSYAVFWFVMVGILCAMWGLRFLRPYLQSA